MNYLYVFAATCVFAVPVKKSPSVADSKDVKIANSKDLKVSDSKDTKNTDLKDSTDVKTEGNDVDWEKDFFRNGEPARLTVSSQLGLEALVPGMGDVYTTNPSYRAEKSKTTRHVASFTHVEAELAFLEFPDLLDFEEEYVTHCFRTVLDKCAGDLKLLDGEYSKGVAAKLESFIQTPFARMSYDEALRILEEKKAEVMKRFPEIKVVPKWGEDLGGYCERYLAEVVHGKPVFVYNMPAPLKSFYMRRNEDGKTVQGCDLLIPGMGELIGGSMRESDYHKLTRVMVERKMYRQKGQSFLQPLDEKLHCAILPGVMSVDEKENHKALEMITFGSLDWYVGLRKNASTPTGGFGLGFDRLVTVCTSSLDGANIRDAIPFPVAYQECHF